MSWVKEIKDKKWIMRAACEKEQIWTFEMIKQYQASECTWKIIEWMYNYGKSGIEFRKYGFAFNVRAEGLLTWKNTPLDPNTTVAWYVTRSQFNKWLKKNGIVKPEFDAAEYVYRD